MKRFLLLILSVFVIPMVYGQGYELIWADEFDLDTVNAANWNFEIGNGINGWGNNELQYYTKRPQNVKIEEGNLVITAIKESYSGFQYTSTRMQTKNKAFWKYGRIEMKAKLPKGRGTWPAFWMMPQNQSYGTTLWPDNGEIDIMEYVGYEPSKVHGTVHTDKNFGSSAVGSTITYYGVENDFHVYAIEWSEDTIKWYVDSYLYGSYKRSNRDWQYWPFDKDFYVILNFAVGGNWGGAQGIDTSIFPQKYIIDYVRVYQKQGGSLSINRVEENDISFSSNPVEDKLQISGFDDIPEFSVHISDVYGNVIYTQKFFQRPFINIDFSLFKSGIYFILIQYKEIRKIIKVVKI